MKAQSAASGPVLFGAGSEFSKPPLPTGGTGGSPLVPGHCLRLSSMVEAGQESSGLQALPGVMLRAQRWKISPSSLCCETASPPGPAHPGESSGPGSTALPRGRGPGSRTTSLLSPVRATPSCVEFPNTHWQPRGEDRSPNGHKTETQSTEMLGVGGGP